MTSIREYLRSLYLIRPEERTRVALMFLYSLLAIGGVQIAGRTIGRTIFLSTLPQSLTPFKYILPPLLMMAVAAWYARATPRYAQNRLIMGTSLAMAAGVLIFRLLLALPLGNTYWAPAAFYAYIEAAAMLVTVQFWSYAGEMFTTREARRLLGTITLGGLLAYALSGAGLRAVSLIIPQQDLLYLVAAGLVGSVLCVYALEKRKPQSGTPTRQSEEFPPLRQVFGEMRASKLILVIGAIVVLVGMVVTIVEYQLDLTLQRFFQKDGQAMLTFLGGLQFWIGFAGLAVQLLATNHILTRFGLLIALLAMPMMVAAGSVAVVATGGLLWAVSLTRAASSSLRYSINDVSVAILYLPIPPRLQRQVKTVWNGVVRPPILGVLGLLFLLVMDDDIDAVGVQASDVVPWSFVVAGLLAVWIALTFVARREYAHALAQTLKRRGPSISPHSLDLREGTTQRVLEESIVGGDEARAVYALGLLADAPSPSWDEPVARLLRHESPAVQRAALHYVEQSANAALAPQVAALLDTPDASVQAAAVSTYCALMGPAGASRAQSMLDGGLAGNGVPEEVQAAAVIGLVRHGGAEGWQFGTALLQAMIESEDADVRRRAAETVGELAPADLSDPLMPLLADENAGVARAAIRAAGRIRHPETIPILVVKLEDRSMSALARRTLARFGPSAVDALTPYMTAVDGPCGRDVRRQIPSILGQIESEGSVSVLLRYADDGDPIMREQVCAALRSLQSAGLSIEQTPEAIDALLMDGIRLAYREAIVWEDLGESGRGELLADALAQQYRRVLNHVFDLLQLRYPYHRFDLIRVGLESEDRRVRANAQELLEMVTAREVGYLLIPIVEDDRARMRAIGVNVFGIARRSREERLDELAVHPETWMRSCALYQSGVLRLDMLRNQVDAATACEDALVRETGLVAGRAILDAEALGGLAARLAQSDPDPRVRAYADYLLQSAVGDGTNA